MEKLIHITDTHLVAPSRRLYGSDPLARLAPAIEVINREHGDAAGVFLTGDLVHWGEEAAYRALRALLDGLSVPYHLVLGNHDARPGFDAVFPDAPRDEAGFVQYTVPLDHGTALVLDTLQDGSTPGRLCPDRLAWLEKRLAALAGHDLFLFLHHPPFDIGIRGMDILRLLEGADELRRLLRTHGRVRHLFFGHVHRPIAGSWAGIPVSTLFGTNHQVALTLTDTTDVFGTLEPPAIGVVLIDVDTVMVHMQSYSYAGPGFPLDSAEAEAAQSPEALAGA